MTTRWRPRRALVSGGSGAVGSEVVRGLAGAGIPTVFTWFTGEARAHTVAAAGAQPHRVDLRQPDQIDGLLRTLELEGGLPDLFIHCAAVSRPQPLSALSLEDIDEAYAVNCRSALLVCRGLASYLAGAGQGHVVLVGALDRAQSLPLPVHFAATQGMLSAMTVALAKELGPAGTRVNMVALGVLEEGLSRQLDPAVRSDYRSFSALRREGTPREAARAILWLALENRYMSGKVLTVNGGI